MKDPDFTAAYNEFRCIIAERDNEVQAIMNERIQAMVEGIKADTERLIRGRRRPQTTKPAPYIDKPTEVEAHMVRLLRSWVEDAVKQNGRQWAAAELQISEVGVDAMLWKSNWTIEKAVRVADLLGVLTHADIDRLEIGSTVTDWSPPRLGIAPPIGTGGLSSNTTGSSEHKKGDTYE